MPKPPIIISNFNLSADFSKKDVIITANLKINNISQNSLNFSSNPIPFNFAHVPKSISVNYKGQNKTFDSWADDTKICFPFEDESNNSLIKIHHTGNKATYFSIDNFQAKTEVYISIQVQTNLIETPNSYIFKNIPTENYDSYPNYSISLLVDPNEKLKITYNGINYIESAEKEIKLTDVSLSLPFEVTFPRQQSKQYSKYNIVQKFIIFISEDALKSPGIISTLIYFMDNLHLNSNFIFYRLGQSGDSFSIEKNDGNGQELVEKNLNSPRNSNFYLNVNETYSRFFSSTNNHEMIAILIGPFNEQFIAQPKVPTYIINPNSRDTQRENFFIISTSNDITKSFENLLKELIINTNQVEKEFDEYHPENVKVSDLTLHIQFNDRTAYITTKFDIENSSNEIYEFEYFLPFNFEYTPISFSVHYDHKYQTSVYSEIFPEVKFDDEIASNNLGIRLKQESGCKDKTRLIICNFPPNKKISISVTILSSLIVTPDTLLFTIPLIPNRKPNFYPDYSIFLQINMNEALFQPVDIEFNRIPRQVHNAYNRMIQYTNISFLSPFIFRITGLKNECGLSKINNKQKKSETKEDETIKSLKETQDIIFFIDERYMKDENLKKNIINFMKNYGRKTRFNIIRLGEDGDVLSKNMITNDEEGLKTAEKFIDEQKKTGKYYSLIETYKNVFSMHHYKPADIPYTEYLSEFIQQNPKQETEVKTEIEESDKLIDLDQQSKTKTVAVLIGSFDDKIIISRKVPTYIIDSYNLHSSASFARHNNFVNIESSLGLKQGFSNLLRELTIPNQSFYCGEGININGTYGSIIRNDMFFIRNFIRSAISGEEVDFNNIGFMIDSINHLRSQSAEQLQMNFNDIMDILNEKKHEFEGFSPIFSQIMENKELPDIQYWTDFFQDAHQIINNECLHSIINQNALNDIMKVNDQIMQMILDMENDKNKTNNEKKLNLIYVFLLLGYQRVIELIRIIYTINQNLKQTETDSFQSNFNDFQNNEISIFSKTITSHSYQAYPNDSISSKINTFMTSTHPTTRAIEKQQHNSTAFESFSISYPLTSKKKEHEKYQFDEQSNVECTTKNISARGFVIKHGTKKNNNDSKVDSNDSQKNPLTFNTQTKAVNDPSLDVSHKGMSAEMAVGDESLNNSYNKMTGKQFTNEKALEHYKMAVGDESFNISYNKMIGKQFTNKYTKEEEEELCKIAVDTRFYSCYVISNTHTTQNMKPEVDNMKENELIKSNAKQVRERISTILPQVDLIPSSSDTKYRL